MILQNTCARPGISAQTTITSFKSKNTLEYEPYELLVDYNDPFKTSELGDNLKLNYEPSVVENPEKSEIPRSLPKKEINFIRYSGIINNPTTRKKAAIISVNGTDFFVKVNEQLKDIRINSIQKDQIQITYSGEKYWIKRQ